jgi:PIN domain nuclease of toxin-antitoxin system
MILLDTCTLLWLVSDQDSLSQNAKKIIVKNASTLFVSAISGFEIAIKNRNRQYDLPLPAMEFYTNALEFHGIHEIPITGKIVIQSVLLPQLHNDPCDRIIIATSMMNSLKILTCDSLISKYKQADVVW